MDHFAPHPGCQFEGYYSKFDLPSGAHIAFIVCTVPSAETRRHKVSFTYVPDSIDASSHWQRQIYLDEMEMVTTDKQTKTFELRAPGVGIMKCTPEATTYDFESEHYSFRAKTTSRMSWADSMPSFWAADTPEGALVNLPLPLHWHVYSLSSTVEYTLEIKDSSYQHLDPRDRNAVAKVHQEKNWAHSFPAAHIWIQARRSPTAEEVSKSGRKDREACICVAGGQIIGTESFLLGYRSPTDDGFSTDFRPPVSVQMAGVSPTMSVDVDWEGRQVTLSIASVSRRIDVHAMAPKGSFFALSAPFHDGHRENFLGQSFQATIDVKVFDKQGGLMGVGGEWKVVEQQTFEKGSLEFGGDYYPPRGSTNRVN